MAENSQPRRPDRGTKAQSLLRRFPVTDLAHAVALSGENRRAFLTQFVDGYTTLSYLPTRLAAPMIYGATPPLLEISPEPWEEVEKHLKATAHPNILDMNLEASRDLFNLVRSEAYVATMCDEQTLRVAFMQVVSIGLRFYVTQGDKLIFQVPPTKA